MEKVARYAPVVLFCSLFIKQGVLGSSYADAIVLAISAVLIIAQEVRIKNKEVLGLQYNLSTLEDELKDQKEEIESLKTYVSSQKMNSLRVKLPNVR